MIKLEKPRGIDSEKVTGDILAIFNKILEYENISSDQQDRFPRDV